MTADDYPSAPDFSSLGVLFAALRRAGTEYAGAISGGRGGQFYCPNPDHDDQHPSFDVHLGDEGEALFTCTPCRELLGQDGFCALLRSIGIEWRGEPCSEDDVDFGDIVAPSRGGRGGRKVLPCNRVTATYQYRHEDGSPNFKVTRLESEPTDGSKPRKRFSPKRWDEDLIEWVTGKGALDGVVRTPLFLEDFDKHRGETIYLVEGEKAATALYEAGYFATTFHGGTSGPRPDDWANWFADFVEVLVWTDLDESGLRWAKQAREELRAAGIKAKVVCNGPKAFVPKGDAYEHLAAYQSTECIRVVSAQGAKAIKALSRKSVRKTGRDDGPSVQAITNPSRRVVAVSLAGVQPEPVTWLMDGLIPLGELTLLAGKQGIGKSTVAYDIAARVSLGTLEGALLGVPRNVLIIATEDSLEHTIVPRLMAAGADLERVHAIEVQRPDGVTGPIDFARDLPNLAELIREHHAALVLVDPLMSRLGGKVDTHKDAEVREVLEPLVAVAHECNAAILALIHVNKSGSSDPLNLVMGSVAFTAVARSVLFLGVDPDGRSRRLLGQVKSNLGPMKEGSLALILETIGVGSANVQSSRVKWGEVDRRSIADLLTEEANVRRGKTVADRSADWIIDYLSSQPSFSASRQDVLDAAQSEWTTDQINKGFRLLKEKGRIDSGREQVQGGTATWTLVGCRSLLVEDGGGDDDAPAY